MTEQDRPETTDDASTHEAATEAAQNVVDEVTSWEYSGERERMSATSVSLSGSPTRLYQVPSRNGRQ